MKQLRSASENCPIASSLAVRRAELRHAGRALSRRCASDLTTIGIEKNALANQRPAHYERFDYPNYESCGMGRAPDGRNQKDRLPFTTYLAALWASRIP